MFTKKYLLNMGLAFTLLYAGITAFLYPFDWIGYVPSWVTNFGFSPLFALHLHSVVETILGLWLLSNKKTKLAALLTALDIFAILITNTFGAGVFLITFRDVGLLFMAIYLAVAD